MSDVLETERLTLRPIGEGDAPGLLRLFSLPEVARWSGDGSTLTTMQQAEARVERYLRRGGGRLGHGVFAVTPKVSEEELLVGVVLLVPLPASVGIERDDVEIGWHLHPDVWGRGYATEAGGAMVQRAWSLGLPEVHAVTHPDNAASQAVCQRLGMTDLGLRDDWYDVTTRAFRRDLTSALVRRAHGPAADRDC